VESVDHPLLNDEEKDLAFHQTLNGANGAMENASTNFDFFAFLLDEACEANIDLGS